MLNEEKLLDETGAILENLQQKSLFQFAQQMFASTNCNRTTEYVVHRLCDTACEARNNCFNWYLHVVQAGEIDHELIVGSDEVRFHLTRPEFA